METVLIFMLFMTNCVSCICILLIFDRLFPKKKKEEPKEVEDDDIE